MKKQKDEQTSSGLLDIQALPVHSFDQTMNMVLDSIDAMVYVADLKSYELLFTNKYLKDNLGAIPGQICWKSIQNSPSGPCGFCPNDKLLNDKGEPGEVYRWEQFNTVDNRWYDTIDRAIRWSDGRLARLTIATDVTERKKMQDSLSETNEKLNTLLKNSPDLIWVIDHNFNIIYSNEIVKASANKNILGQSVLTYMKEDYHHKFEKIFYQVIENQKTTTFEYEGLIGRWWEAEVAPISLSSSFDNVMLITRDITARKIVKESLIESNERLNTLLKNSPDSILVINQKLQILYSNAYDRMEAKLVSDKLSVLENMDPVFHEPFESSFWDAVNNRKTLSFDYKDKQGKWWETRIAQMTVSSDAKCAMLINRDMTDRKKVEELRKQSQHELERRINERNAELEQTYQQLIQRDKMTTLGFLVSSIAHEINNPNSFISFNIPILKDYITDILPVLDKHAGENEEYEICGLPYDEFREDVINLLSNMQHGSQRINDTVANLRDFIGAQQEKEFKSVELKTLIEKGVELCRNKINSRVQRFEMEIPNETLIISTVPQSLEQILVNFLINAAQSVDKNDSWIKLVVSNTHKPDWIAIEVQDNGCGIKPDHLHRIFDPFFTTKKKQSGLGLGLNITKKLAEEIGGQIEVDSKPGVGSCFRLLVPIQQQKR